MPGLVDRVISFCNRKDYTYEFEGSKFYGLPLEENEMISPEGVTDYVKKYIKTQTQTISDHGYS